MFEKRRIGFVAEKYHISVRTLRYYEEIGLLTSYRNPQNGYRYYDSQSMKELEKILILRSVELSMEEIFQILKASNASQILQCLKDKMESLSESLQKNEKTISKLRYLIALLGKKEMPLLSTDQSDSTQTTFALIDSLKIMENKEKEMSHDEKKIDDCDVRILSLPACDMITYRVISASPEKDAWEKMMKWLSSKDHLDRRFLRYFGFDNPGPSEGKTEYGYEVWVTKPDGLVIEDPFVEKKFQGGFYAVTVCTLDNIGERWMQLCHWVKNNNIWEYREDICLEESISPSGVIPFQLDLFEPIQKKAHQ